LSAIFLFAGFLTQIAALAVMIIIAIKKFKENRSLNFLIFIISFNRFGGFILLRDIMQSTPIGLPFLFVSDVPIYPLALILIKSLSFGNNSHTSS